MTNIHEDNARKAHSEMGEAAFEKKAEKMLSGHRQAPNGRNVFAFVMRHLNNDAYKGKFDNTFKDAPGSPKRLDRDYCPECDKKKAWCECPISAKKPDKHGHIWEQYFDPPGAFTTAFARCSKCGTLSDESEAFKPCKKKGMV